MDLYLIRHAEALALGERGVTEDESRPLSESGEQQAEAAGKALQKLKIKLDGFYSSPLVRAKQTAEIMLKTWATSALTLETRDELEPGKGPRKLSRFMLKQKGERIGLVGHMPHLAEITAWLIGSKKAQIEIAKAGIVYLTCGDAPGKGMAVLQWLVTPEWYGDATI